MADLTKFRKSPLNGESFGDSKKVLIKEIPFLRSFDLRVAPGSKAAKEIEQALKIKLPQQVGLTAKQEVTCLALGPDWWLLVADNDSIIIARQQKLKSEFVSLVDVSSQRTCIEVSGFWAKSVLEHAWEQDLDEVMFPVGSCSQGLMARCPTILHKTAANNYRLYVRSSFAEHLYKFLVDASTEYLN